MNNIDWKRWGKVALVALPVIIWVAWYEIIKLLHAGSEWFNDFGDEWLENFLNKD